MSATQASLDALAGATRTRSGSVDTRIDKAFKALRREGADITISSVARRAGVTRNSIHRRKDVLARIRAHQPVAAVTEDIPPAPHGDTSIVAALRRRLTAKDTQITELKSRTARTRSNHRAAARTTRQTRYRQPPTMTADPITLAARYFHRSV